jgi:hypothetical protein
MRQTCTVVITEWRNENLRFVFEPSERFGMQNAVAVALEAGAYR